MYTLEEHESNISELIEMLNVEGIDQAKVSKIIQGLRDNYSETQTSITTLSNESEILKQTHTELKASNMDLLSKLGTQYLDVLSKNKEDIKNQNNGSSNNKGGQDEDILSNDDIVNNFLGGK